MSAPDHPAENSHEDPLRPHIYDGIQEFDKRLPNWWLWTLYGTILFSAGYWVLYHQMEIAPEPGVAVTAQIKESQLIAAKNAGQLTDEVLWNMSKDPQVVAAGKATFDTTCASCHMPTMTGGIGPNLVDNDWIHGGKPLEVVKTITEGVPAKGMLTWGPMLGQKKIGEVAAYILSKHSPSDPVRIVPSPTPGQAIATPQPPSDAAPAAVQ